MSNEKDTDRTEEQGTNTEMNQQGSEQATKPTDDLQPGERTRLIIIEGEDGQILVSAKSAERVDPLRMIGLLETAKVQIIDTNSQGAQEEQLVEVTLDEVDFEMDLTGMLKQAGKKPGDKALFPLALLDLREAGRAEYISNKETAGETQVPADEESGTASTEDAPADPQSN